MQTSPRFILEESTQHPGFYHVSDTVAKAEGRGHYQMLNGSFESAAKFAAALNEERKVPVQTKEEEHLDALQALVDNWLELGVGPSDGLREAQAHLEANGRAQEKGA